MPFEPPDHAAPGGETGAGAARTIAIGAAVITVLAVGWFALSWRVEHTPAGDAIGESLGVAFALLIVLSVIGAIRGRENAGSNGDGSDDGA